MKKARLDQLLVERGMVDCVDQAQRYIMAGTVWVENQPAHKPGTLVSSQAELRLQSPEHPWVSRAGVKLRHALDVWQISPQGCICLDVGASTGGFTDVLLTAGAAKVYAVDVGYGILSWKLVQNPRVVNLERTNIRFLSRDRLPDPIDMLVVDVSFISLAIVLPIAQGWLKADGVGVVLIKPQFELARELIEKGGIVRLAAHRQQAIDQVSAVAEQCGLVILGITASPITGAKGNQEFLLYFRTRGQ